MNRNTIGWMLRIPGGKNGYVVFLMFLQALNGALGVFYALFLRDIVDSASAHDVSGFRLNVMLIIALVLVQLAIRAVIRHMNELTKATLENIYKQRLIRTLFGRRYSEVSATHTAEWINRLTNDTKVIADGYTEIVPGLLGMAVKLISALIMVTILEPVFAYILIPSGIVMALFTYLFRRKLKTLHKEVQEKDGDLRIFLQERISSLMLIKSYSAEDKTSEGADELLKEHKDSRMKRNLFANICNIGFGVAMNALYLTGVIYCGYGILAGTITFGTLTAITQLITQIQAPFANITGYLPRLFAMSASAERLMEAESYEGEDRTGEISGNFQKISINNVSFTYEGDIREAVSNFSAEIKRGEYVAFTGHSGCGKSTILKLILDMYRPDEGSIDIVFDGRTQQANAQTRDLFAYVPQDNALMNDTIRNTVAFSEQGKADDEKIRRALEIACAADFTKELDNGTDTMLGERGAGLSEGQMQRIAIARAIYSDRPILLLDEATSALDEDTEAKLLQNLRDMTDKTVMIVTHRQKALTICDKTIDFTTKTL